MMTTASTEPPASVAGLRFLGLPTWIRADRNGTGGRVSLVEQLIPAGFASPWHVHHDEDESFYVIKGAMTVIVGDSRTLLGTGGYAFGPRGVPHGFRIEGDGPARILLMSTGGSLSDFIAEASVPEDMPPAAPDMAALMASAERHGMAILGPLPG